MPIPSSVHVPSFGSLGRAVRRAAAAVVLATAAGAALAPRPAQAQWSTVYESFYLQAPHNWVFRDQYQAADRLFNAFDYGHAILYETLWNAPNAPASVLEQGRYDFLTKKVLVKPPRVPLAEGAIEVNYAKLAPEAKAMFDWAHLLHRQIYDVLADERLDQGAKDREIARLVAYYKTQRALAFSSRPKSMKLMQEQPYSLAFRKHYPKFNGLIWGYHWLQVGLYEPLMVGRTQAERQAGVRATVARFWQMLGDPPRTLPYQMPMTAAVAPTFAGRYPEAAIIFDNLHSMHDVISDILANPSVPRDRKRAEIQLAARRFRDDTTLVMASTKAWRTMAREMGIENMGGPAVAFLPALPTPTVTYGAVMSHDDRSGQMVGVKYGAMTGAHGGMTHGGGAMAGMDMSGGTAPAAGVTPGGTAGGAAGRSMPGMTHGGAARGDSVNTGMDHGTMDHGTMTHEAATPAPARPAESADLIAMHRRMMADPVIRRRMMADPELRLMMAGTMARSVAHREAFERDPGLPRDFRHALRGRAEFARRSLPGTPRRPGGISRTNGG